eukprot:TRINITY_DN27385_c0_g1_i1.p1 TRINITY_DN27385_c0_g1~~TRINITY_DN27385_c0_g1_i1.p1  ORF type:complete len:373 (+),score=96.90 TRINITY_DN27385_c0_g1_i1:80-1198(+)
MATLTTVSSSLTSLASEDATTDDWCGVSIPGLDVGCTPLTVACALLLALCLLCAWCLCRRPWCTRGQTELTQRTGDTEALILLQEASAPSQLDKENATVLVAQPAEAVAPVHATTAEAPPGEAVLTPSQAEPMTQQLLWLAAAPAVPEPVVPCKTPDFLRITDLQNHGHEGVYRISHELVNDAPCWVRADPTARYVYSSPDALWRITDDRKDFALGQGYATTAFPHRPHEFPDSRCLWFLSTGQAAGLGVEVGYLPAPPPDDDPAHLTQQGLPQLRLPRPPAADAAGDDASPALSHTFFSVPHSDGCSSEASFRSAPALRAPSAPHPLLVSPPKRRGSTKRLPPPPPAAPPPVLYKLSSFPEVEAAVDHRRA